MEQLVQLMTMLRLLFSIYQNATFPTTPTMRPTSLFLLPFATISLLFPPHHNLKITSISTHLPRTSASFVSPSHPIPSHPSTQPPRPRNPYPPIPTPHNSLLPPFLLLTTSHHPPAHVHAIGGRKIALSLADVQPRRSLRLGLLRTLARNTVMRDKVSPHSTLPRRAAPK